MADPRWRLGQTDLVVDEQPLVSVVIAAYNAEGFVGTAIDSVLAQTWERLECIVVDDGSTDGTAARVEQRLADPRVRLLRQPNGGVSAARNAAMAAASGEFIAFLDADDVWLPDKVAEQVALFRRRPELGLVFCDYAIVDARLQPRSVVRLKDRELNMRRWLLLEGDGMGLAFTGMVRTDIVRSEGGFSGELSTSADLEFAIRLARSYPVDSVHRVLSLYRTHGGQMHLDMAAFEHDMIGLLAEAFDADGRLLRRGRANLFARVFWTELARGRFGVAAAALWRTLDDGPTRLVGIPVSVLSRRAERRLNLTRWRRSSESS